MLKWNTQKDKVEGTERRKQCVERTIPPTRNLTGQNQSVPSYVTFLDLCTTVGGQKQHTNIRCMNENVMISLLFRDCFQWYHDF